MSGRGLFYVRSMRLVAGARAVLASFSAVGVLFGALAPSLDDALVRPLAEVCRRNGFTLVTGAEKDRLLRTYWSIPERQVETSVVLADRRWMERTRRGA